jgi:hypothetical protein
MGAIYVGDDHGNEAVFPSPQECVEGLCGWFAEVLAAEAEGMSDEGIEEELPGLLARLQGAIASVSRPAGEATLDELAAFATALAAAVESACATAEERRAVGVPVVFRLRAATPLETPDFEALAALRKRS